jgi:hypothetical protein
MVWSLPAKTGWRTSVSTRSIMLDSRGMAIPLVMNHVVESSDFLLSLRKSHTKAAGRVQSRRGKECAATGCLSTVRARILVRNESDSRGPSGTRLVLALPIRRSVRDAVPSLKSREGRQRVEGRTRRRFRLFCGENSVITSRTGGVSMGGSTSRVDRRGAPWADCCLWTTTRI